MKANMFLVASVVYCVLVLSIASGCAIFSPVAEKIASGIEKYCQEPYSFRQVYANTVNSQLTASGHVVHVHCLGDPPPTP